MDQRKTARMDPFSPELDRQGVDYRPFAISCWGRLHPAAAQMLRNAAKMKARREGMASETNLYRHFLGRVGALIWRRAARMALRCRPQGDDDDERDDPKVDVACSIRAGDPSHLNLPTY